MLTGMRSSRVNLPNRCCHLIGRVAHRAFFLDDGERTRLADLIRRVSRVSATRTWLTGLGTTDVPGSSLAAVTVSRAGLVVSARSETGVTATYEYDALGRQVAQVDGRGGRTETVYDAQGRVTRTVDALGAATAYGHDALGRRTSVTDPLTNAVTTAYDAEGRVVSVRGAAYPVRQKGRAFLYKFYCICSTVEC